MYKRCDFLIKQLYGDDWQHPYRVFENTIKNLLKPGGIILDGGCGREISVLMKINKVVGLAVGLDSCTLSGRRENPNIKLIRGDLTKISLQNDTADMVISRSVLEHMENPELVYREFHRILKPGGYFIFLTPNLFDYGSLISKIVPNRFHPWIVRLTEGRSEIETFPAFYKSNTESSIRSLGEKSGFRTEDIKYLGQYPSYLMFNCVLFGMGALYDKFISSTELLKKLRGWILAVLVKDIAREI